MNNNEYFKNVRFLTVSALNRYINYKFEIDEHLKEVYLQGEISNFKRSGKHMYFSIKDEYSEISAMIFYPYTENLQFNPSDGMVVQVMGAVKVYEKRGTYSIVVKKMVQEGIGKLYQDFLDLKEKLQKEGLFDIKHKMPIPKYPKKIAVITAATGDAIHDIISTFERRLPLASLTLFPALVQGADAPRDLIRALKEVYEKNEFDCLIIGRGGGSFEDLSCFNDEKLARTLFASPIPTVSAIGHEADFTICDFVSSLRAPTPTGAAMLLTKNKEDIIQNIELEASRIERNFKYRIQYFEKQLVVIEKNLNQLSPKMKIENNLHLLSQYQYRINTNFLNKINKLEHQVNVITKSIDGKIILGRVDKSIEDVKHYETILKQKIKHTYDQNNLTLVNIIDRLTNLNPLNIMKKGYGIIYQNNNVIDKVEKVNLNENIDIRLSDGMINALVIDIKKMKNEE
ncbi:MAG: exodeoxyribonuclease VII large subunit [Bacilli bacterium]|nr:exodeoxyribonuclease VII large subunit [Bacilli bacterium]